MSTRPAGRLRRAWEKNAPPLLALLTGRLPRFVTAPDAAAAPPPTPPVFCYHHVDAQSFEHDLQFLADNGYRTLTADELCDRLEAATAAPAGARAVALTFDDGSATLYHAATPLLARFGMTGVAFVAPRFHVDVVPADLPGPIPCTRPQLLEMHASGVWDIQGHTLSHRFLPRYPEPMPLIDSSPQWCDRFRGDAPGISAELAESKALLEEWLDKPIRHLAFPSYQGTSHALEVGRKLGYRGFYWGVRPPRSAHPTTHIQRLDARLLRRLPGRGRLPLRRILTTGAPHRRRGRAG